MNAFQIISKLQYIFFYPAYVSLYYKGSNGTGRAITLIGKVMKAMADIKDQINRGNKPAVPDGMGKYISIEEKEGNPEVYCIYDKWQIDILTKRIDIENAFNHFLNFSQRGIDTGE